MRTAKYNDFLWFRILLVIAVIVVAFLVLKNYIPWPCQHQFDAKSFVKVDPTCTEDGYSYKVCTECGEQIDNKVLPALGHEKADEYTVIEEPTCTKTGTAYFPCIICDANLENAIIPATGHTEGEAVTENIKEHTASQGASWENVIYCTVCDEELSRVKDEVDHETEIRKNIITDPTCEGNGKLAVITYCIDCDKQIGETYYEDIEPLGHSFEWILTYEEGDFVVSGVCTAEECEHVYDPAVDAGYSISAPEKDDARSVAPTCVDGYDVYVCRVTYNTQVVAEPSVNVTVKAVLNHTIKNDDGDILDISEFVQYDEYGHAYYNRSTFAEYCVSIVYEKKDGQTTSEAIAAAWDENGFASGAFLCANHDGENWHWVEVRVYNDLA